MRDLGSTNGTRLNGQLVANDEPVRDGDRIEFGSGGPLVELRFHSVPDESASRTAVLRAFYAGQNRRLRSISIALGGALVLVVTGLAVVGSMGRRQRAGWQRERAALLSRIDSLMLLTDQTAGSIGGDRDELAEMLRASQEEVREARAALERAAPETNAGTVERLHRELRVATEALARQQLAASLDFRAIEQANRDAVALIYLEAEDGRVATATGFAVTPDGTMITARHVLTGRDGSRRARRIAVQFSDSDQYFPAHIAAVSERVDLALLSVDSVLGEVPVVAGFNTRTDTVAAGAPVAIIGYALGGETAGPLGAARTAARPLITAAIIAAVSPERVELQGYGAAGASGSPVFDAHGRVVAIVIGGASRDGRNVLVGVPVSEAEQLLRQTR